MANAPRIRCRAARIASTLGGADLNGVCRRAGAHRRSWLSIAAGHVGTCAGLSACEPPACRRALELLAGRRDGVPEALMLAHGFSIELIVKLVHAGLATASAERTVGGRHPVEVTRVRITDAGRRALAGRAQP